MKLPTKVTVKLPMKAQASNWSTAVTILLGRPTSLMAILVTITLQFAPASAQTSVSASSNSYSSPGSAGSSIPGSSTASPVGGFQSGGYPNGGLPYGGFTQSMNQPTALPGVNYLLGGGYRYGINGTFINPFGQQVFLNPLVPFVWPGSRPQFTGGAAFTCRIGNFNCNFWKGSSGYYYPFLSNSFLYAPIIFVDHSSSMPLAKLPPPAIQLTDTLKYLDDSSKDKKVAESHYKHLKQRATDLQRKERSMRIAQGGELDAESEAEIRRDLDGLAKEISAHVKDR